MTDSPFIVRFEVFMAVTMKNAFFWDVMPCGSCKYHVSEELSASIIRVTRIGEPGIALVVTGNRRTLSNNTKCCVRLLLVTINVPSSPILVTMMMEALSSSETSILAGVTRLNIPEDGTLSCHCFRTRLEPSIYYWRVQYLIIFVEIYLDRSGEVK
jgi:hypothetical protein